MNVHRRARTAPCALTILLLLVARPAAADCRVELDCYLADADLECQDVRRAFGDSVPGVGLDGDDPQLRVRLRDVEVALGRRYFATFEGRPAGGADEARFELVSEVPTSAGHDRALALVVALLQRGSVPFLEVSAPGTAEDGVLHLEVSAGDVAGAAADAPSPWYVRPSVTGGYVRAGVELANVGGGLEINYSDPEWRWRVEGELQYRYLDVPLGNESLEGDFLAYRARSTFARSFEAGFSVALYGGVESAPNNNRAFRGEAGAGVEWVLSPFLRANETNVGARVRIAGRYDEYVTPNIENATERVFAEPSATLFGRVHTQPVDLELQATAACVLDRPELWSVGGNLSAAFRIADGLQLTIGGGVLYRSGALHAPADPSAIDPVATAVSGSDFGELTVQTEALLSWAIGNSLLRSQDQRWR